MENVIQTFVAEKTFTSSEEFYSSEELQEIYSYYAPSALKTMIKISKENDFIKVFKVEVDPKKNYGTSFKLFELYKTFDGLIILQEVSACSIMSNSPFREVKLTENGFAYTDSRFSRQQRRLLAKHEVIVTTDA